MIVFIVQAVITAGLYVNQLFPVSRLTIGQTTTWTAAGDGGPRSNTSLRANLTRKQANQPPRLKNVQADEAEVCP